METSFQLCLVLTTWPADREVDGLATALVGERLAACVNVLAPMTSHYMWEGTLERTPKSSFFWYRDTIARSRTGRAAPAA